MAKLNLNTIKRIAVQKAETKCDGIIANFKQTKYETKPELIKQTLNGLLIGESIRFSETLFSDQYNHITNKVKDWVSSEFGQDFAMVKLK